MLSETPGTAGNHLGRCAFNHQIPGRDIPSDSAAGADHGPGADAHRRVQRGIVHNKRARATECAIFVNSGLITCDGAGGESGVGADFSVPEIGQMAGFDPAGQSRVLDLDEIA